MGFSTRNRIYANTLYIATFRSSLYVDKPSLLYIRNFLTRKHKPAFYDAAVSFVHPITGIFPHANGGELFVWLGIAAGVEIVAPDMVTALAVRYLLAGLVVILIRGIVTDIIYSIMVSRKESAA